MVFALALLSRPDLPELDFIEKWRIEHPAKGWNRGFSETTIVGSRIFFVEETARDSGAYGCLDAKTGKRLWSMPTKLETTHYLEATPKYGVVSGEHRLLAFDVRNGRKVWTGTRQGFGAGPLIAGDRLIAELKDGILSAVDLRTGRTVWQSRFPARIQTKTGFDRATLIGDSIWTADARGQVTKISVATGRRLWTRSFPAGEVSGFVRTKHGIVVFGTVQTEMWNTTSSRPIWVNKALKGWGGGLYHPSSDQIWTIPSDGLLHRYSAATGRPLGNQPAMLANTGQTFEPVAYRGGIMVLSSGPVVQIDASGEQVGKFDPQESIFELEALGDDLLLHSENGLVRLSPGTLPTPRDPRAAAASLAAQERLLPMDRRVLVGIGREAVPALVAAIPSAKGERQETLLEVLEQVARPEDTAAILQLAEKLRSGQPDTPAFPAPITRWLLRKGDGNQVALAFLERFRTASDEGGQLDVLPFVLRGIDDRVVDVLLARLKDAKTPASVRGAIYGEIAKSGRADVLQTIREIRQPQRRLEVPIKELSATKDTDGDGLPDNFDANPAVAPRVLTEKEKAMLAAFDARFRFDGRTEKIGLVDYSEGVRPFELIGWRGGLVPEKKAGAMGLRVPQGIHRSYPYPYLRFEPKAEGLPAVGISADGQTATVEIGVTYGGLDGIGFRVKLRKFGDEWYSVEMTETWIS